MSNISRPRNPPSAVVEFVVSIGAALSILVVPALASAEEEGSYPQGGPSASSDDEALAGFDQPEAAGLYRSGSKIRTAGMVLTILGLGLGATGVGLIAAAATIHAETGEGTLEMGGAGFFVLTPATLMLLIGIPLWAVGAARRNRARSRGYEALSLQPWFAMR